MCGGLLVHGEQSLGFIHDGRGETLALDASHAGEAQEALLLSHGDGEVRPGQVLGGAQLGEDCRQFLLRVGEWAAPRARRQVQTGQVGQERIWA